MPGSAHSEACAGLWKRDVALNTARPAAAGSAVVNSSRATPSAMILGRDQQFEPAAQSLRGRACLVRGDDLQRLRHPGEPPLRHGVAQRLLAREVPVHAAVADAEGPGDVDHGGLGRSIAAEDVLRGVKDPVAGQRRLDHAELATLRSLSSTAISAAA